MPAVITIARKYGSGGSELGHELARRLGFRFVDREILKRAATELNLTDRELAHREERIQSFWARLADNFSLGVPDALYTPPPLPVVSDGEVFQVQSRILREIAAEAPCIVMGRAGFHVLASGGPRLHLFVHSPMAHRIERVQRLYHIETEAAARDLITTADRTRERYVSQMTGAAWRQAENYQLSLDASLRPISQLADWLESLARQYLGDTAGTA